MVFLILGVPAKACLTDILSQSSSQHTARGQNDRTHAFATAASMEPSDPKPPRRRPRPWPRDGDSQGLAATACFALLVVATAATSSNDEAPIRPSLLRARQAAFCPAPPSSLPRLSPSSGCLLWCQPSSASPMTGSRSISNNVHNTMRMMTKKEDWSPFRLFAFGRGEGGTVKTPPASTGTKKKQQQQQQQQQPKKKEEKDKGWFAFPSPFSRNSQQQDQQKTRKKGKKKKEEEEKQKGWFSLPSLPSFPWSGGFASFNSEWKDQLTLAKKIKKLEKEVAKDYIRGEKAKVAQYRYEALRTLEEVQGGREGGQAAVEFDPILAGKTKKSQRLEVKDAKLLLRQQQQQQQLQQQLQQQGQGEESMPLKPEDLDSMLQQLESVAKDEQQWARLASACVGALFGLLLIPSHDFFGVLFLALFMTFLTTTSGLAGDAARMSGYSLLSLTKALSQFEKRFALLRRVREVLWEMAEASVPFKFELKNEESLKNWRNAYKGEGFLHPDIRPAPPMRDAQYVEYLREVKRWVEVEEREVLRALRRKEDERASGVREREERRERMQKVLVGLWQGSATAATMVGGMVGGISKREGGREGGVEEGARGEGGMEDDVAFLKRFAELERGGRTGGRKGRKAEGEEDEEEEEEERDDEMNEEEIFFDEGYVDGGGGGGGQGGGGDRSGEGMYDGGEGGEKGVEMDLGPFAGGIVDRGGA